MMTWPKPVRKPGVPVIMGGAFPFGARRAIAYGDGWMPHVKRPQYDDVSVHFAEFRQMMKEAGRDPATLPITVWGLTSTSPADQVKRYRDEGVDRIVFNVEPELADKATLHLDKIAALMR
jgi:alkanesulfonate monooxygenase SsuD/methylene tetrahydromethanopterin reductase-like flavin-dependent oxidoreductase (luciferase family)